MRRSYCFLLCVATPLIAYTYAQEHQILGRARPYTIRLKGQFMIMDTGAGQSHLALQPQHALRPKIDSDVINVF